MTPIHVRLAVWLIAVTLISSINSAARGDALPWYEDDPQPHGPGGTVLVDHQPSNFGGLASDTLFDEFPGWQRVADDFSISQSAAIHKIVWWGFYALNILPTVDDTFRIRVYDQRPGDLLPGAVLYEQSFSNVPRAWTGRFILDSGAPREFRYEVDLPLALVIPVATPHWLEIVQVGDISTRFRWENSNPSLPQNGKAVINPITANMDWEYSLPQLTTNTAFQLISIPEPCTFGGFAISAVILVRRRRPQNAFRI